VTYRVILTENARAEMQEDAIWWARHRDSSQAGRWLDGFTSALLTLTENPEKHPLAKESQRYRVELRQLLYGLGKQPTHRAVFQICDAEVVVYGIRHLARRDLTIDDLER